MSHRHYIATPQRFLPSQECSTVDQSRLVVPSTTGCECGDCGPPIHRARAGRDGAWVNDGGWFHHLSTSLVRLSAVASYACFTERETESVVDCKYIRPDICTEELSVDPLFQSTRTTTVLLAVNRPTSTVSIVISPKILVATSLCFREASIEQSGQVGTSKSLSLARRNHGSVYILGPDSTIFSCAHCVGGAYHIKEIVKGRYYYPRDPGESHTRRQMLQRLEVVAM